MKRFKIYLNSGTVLTVQADEIRVRETSTHSWLTLNVGERIVAQFAPGMWEGYQDVTPPAPKEKEVSGS